MSLDMRSFTFLLGVVACALVCAQAIDLQIFERLATVPPGWKQVSVPSPTRRLRFRIAIKNEHEALFEQLVLDISTPNHPKYGQHLSKTELKSMLRPSASATEAIIGWLSDEGIPARDIEDDGDWINFYASVADAERIMNTRFYNYQSNDVTLMRTLEYSVPQKLHKYIQMIQPTIRFGQIRPQRSLVLDHFKLDSDSTHVKDQTDDCVLDATFCNTTITPSCLRALYGLDNFTQPTNISNTLGICGYLDEWAKYDDLEVFLEEYAPYAVGSNFSWVSINGGLLTQDSSQDDVEANLDMQYGLSLSYPAPVTYYSTAGLGELVPDLDQPTQADNENEPYLEFLHYVLALDDDELPTTLTTSYGEDEQSVPESYAKSTCSLFAQLGARGVSVLFSSGDSGVGEGCLKNDGSNKTAFLPVFPASCPYVTSVGGTYHVEPERAISFSSGGFSEYWSRPSWQNESVSAYLEILGDQWDGLYNPSGRGFPDVAAQAYNFSVVEDDGTTVDRVGGTSCSSPTFAAIISDVNSVLIANGKSPLGFLNPWIYQYGKDGLTDIVHGGSTGCTGTDSSSGLAGRYVPHASWNATEGWDPVTGWGTPKFKELVNLALEYGSSSTSKHRRSYGGARRSLHTHRWIG
ncbi:MAG: vesicle formation at the endoplasmic reticulum [Cirrosporium novae-zelandiae]|nr:MAG: vesicle formation at the endoplasmic reticulum [Cirrosporium novae-zelandiae]